MVIPGEGIINDGFPKYSSARLSEHIAVIGDGRKIVALLARCSERSPPGPVHLFRCNRRAFCIRHCPTALASAAHRETSIPVLTIRGLLERVWLTRPLRLFISLSLFQCPNNNLSLFNVGQALPLLSLLRP